MKSFISTILLAAIVLTIFGQDSTKTKTYKNEFGIDATAFIKQFLNFNTGQLPDYYYATYYLTYRRHFKCGNIRFGIGGSFSDYDIPSISFSSRIGWEFFDNLNKRWQVFYGVDFRPTISQTKNDANYWSGGYANGSDTKSQTYGIAPLLGFRFRLNNRLSISTETSFSINWQQTDSRKYYIPVTSSYPKLPDSVTPTIKKIFSSFAQPLSLFFTFDI